MIKNILMALTILLTSTCCFGGILSDANGLSSKINGSKVMVVSGSSMKPILKNGDVVVIKTFAKEALRPGMVCVYRNELGETIIHSVVSNNPLVLKGANNKVVDPGKVIDVLGIMYATFYNWNHEKIVEEKTRVLAKKY